MIFLDSIFARLLSKGRHDPQHGKLKEKTTRSFMASLQMGLSIASGVLKTTKT